MFLLGHLFHVEQRIALGHRRAPVQRFLLADGRRDGRVDQLVQGFEANHLQHVAHFSRRRADVAAVGKVIGFVIGQFEGHVQRSCEEVAPAGGSEASGGSI